MKLLLATTPTTIPTEVPLSLIVGLAVILVIGVIVWLLGQRLIRPMLVLMGAGVGAGLGFIGGAFLPYEVSIWWPVIAGACILALFAFGMYRLFMAVTLAATLALTAPLGFFAFAEVTDWYADEPSPEVEPDELRLPLPISEQLQEQIDRLDELADERVVAREKPAPDAEEDKVEPTPFLPQIDPETRERVAETVDHWRARLRGTIERIADVAATQWQDFPAQQKIATLLTAAVGVVLGFVGGMLMPNLAAMLATSLAGAALLLMSGLALLRAVDLSHDAIEPGSAAGSLVMWLAVGLIGTIFQLRVRRRTAEKKREDAE